MPAAVSPDKTKIGYIGLGVMGKAMARNILKAGYRPRYTTAAAARWTS